MDVRRCEGGMWKSDLKRPLMYIFDYMWHWIWKFKGDKYSVNVQIVVKFKTELDY